MRILLETMCEKCGRPMGSPVAVGEPGAASGISTAKPRENYDPIEFMFSDLHLKFMRGFIIGILMDTTVERDHDSDDHDYYLKPPKVDK